MLLNNKMHNSKNNFVFSREKFLPVKVYPRGYTLVELLVTISIISFLLSIIVPVLGRARDKSNLIVCKANLRSLTTASLIYSGDNDSKLPVDKKMDNPHRELIDKLSGGNYIDTIDCYYCPSTTDQDLRQSPQNYEAGNISYFYFSFTDRPANRYLSNFFLKSTPWPHKLYDTMSPKKWVFSDCWFSNMPTAHRWYKKGVNYSRLDGSVQMVKASPRQEFK